ncbi:hypothetical protein FIV42_16485 [Persicimonas caeni]|uniref:Lipoprotein n=1 Tax=Persicimonas caeni TaxID=2292766 RepID=A0A4Y6PW93_PERCE|nr:hypothetical protein [Persicimonas caeni]QDG52277.1 hypothetical protein FIV42_16485 [Persicimonas caeni]QED33499.1 hypothetical protein FRD00_16480 [Persicimonas caeni]
MIHSRPLVLATLALLLATTVACDDDSTDNTADADADVALADTNSHDTNSHDTNSTDGLPATCEGACREHALTVAFGDTTGPIERAVYGLTAPEVADSGEWEVYIEAIEGGFDGCPQQDSPTPDWSLIVTGLVAPIGEGTLTKADDGVAVTFLDYDGRFLGQEPFARATSASLTPVAANVDTSLVAAGTRDEDGVVALDVQASFDGGELSGRLVATHCASMD